jgi:hypothetical protein
MSGGRFATLRGAGDDNARHDGDDLPTLKTNAVVLAIVVALLDLEQRRERGKVRRPMTPRRIT